MFRQAVRTLLPKSSLGYDLPDRAYFEHLLLETKYTPDIAVLEQHEWQLYFAHDETQSGHLKHDLLGESKYQMPGFTQKSFNYWDGGPVFGAVPLEATGFIKPLPGWPDIAKIKGQIFLIRPKAFLTLDDYKENGVQFVRTKGRVIVPYRLTKFLHDTSYPDIELEWVSEQGHIGLTKEKVCVIKAWMYTGVPAFWDKLISNYDWRSVTTFEARNRNWCRTYYQVRRPPTLK